MQVELGAALQLPSTSYYLISAEAYAPLLPLVPFRRMERVHHNAYFVWSSSPASLF